MHLNWPPTLKQNIKEVISLYSKWNQQVASEQGKYHDSDTGAQSLSFIHTMGSEYHCCLSSSG